MSNICQPNSGWAAIDPEDPYARRGYAQSLIDLFKAETETLNTAINGFDPEQVSVPAAGVRITYPDVADFNDLKPINVDLQILVPTMEARPNFLDINEPSKPNIPAWTLGDLSINIPNIPDPSIPEFTTDAPPINYPTMPAPLAPLVLPDDPILNPITLPAFTMPSFPAFDGVPPEVDLVEPALDVNPGDNNYVSRLKDAVEDKLYRDVINGGTGLDPEIETAIFQRESERSLQTHNDRLLKLRAEWLKGHYPLPTSMLYAMISEADIDYTNKRLDASRDISIEQAKLAQTNTHFTIEKALVYEQTMITWFNNIAQRTFESSKFVVEAGIKMYEANVQKYNLLTEIYKSKAQVYDIVTKAEISKLEAFRLQLEAAKLTGEINKTNVDIYKTKVEVLGIFITQYRAELEAAKTWMESETLKLQSYKTVVEAYGVRVNAQVAYYNMFNTRIEGEKAKVQAYAAGADAFSKRVQAIKLGIDAESAFIQASADINKSMATVYDSDAKVFSSKVQAEIATVEGEVKIYEAQVKAYEAEAKVLGIIGDFELKEIDVQLNEYKIEFESALQAAKLKVEQILEKWKLKFNIMETEAQVIAQVTSAAMNADSLTTHLSKSESVGQNSQISCSEVHTYDESTV